MATIALYANKINHMPGLIQDVKKSVLNYKAELSALKNKSLKINQSICNMDDVVSSIQASSQTQEEKVTSLEAFRQSSEQFIEDTARIDSEVADVIRQRKDDFYEQYNYLKPKSEKSWIENKLDTAGAWCKEHWKLIVTVVLVVVAVVLMCTGVGGPFGAIILGACEGLIKGAVIGGILGGLSNLAAGKSFFEGFENGAFSGALMGAFFGGLGGAGRILGSSCKVLKFLGSAAKAIPVISEVSIGISLGMFGFDLLSLGISLFDSANMLVQFNQKLHSSKLYNAFQFGVSALAAFSGGFTKGMQNPTCFVAGTMILTAAGLTAIEHIKAGDKVISTNPETGETAEKTVLETYIRETDKLVHLTVNDEEIITTVDHPFYVDKLGFVNAGQLWTGAQLLDVKGNLLNVEDMRLELAEKPVTVYNFQVEEFHTYYVGENSIFVHNAECKIEFKNKSGLDEDEYKQQLSDQQDGLNKLTVDEYLKNRQDYQANGRNADSSKYQRQARTQIISERTKSNINKGMSYDDAVAEANSWAKGKAALHGPDQIAGGRADNIIGLGDSRINSSIGSQWKSLIGALDDYVKGLAENLTKAEMKTTKLDVELILK